MNGADGAGIADRVQFGVLGPLEMSIGGTLVPLGTPKQRAVLAVMIIHANRAVAVDALLDATWDHQPPEGARATLHAYISNLRRLMTGVGIDRAVLASVSRGYRLAIANDQCDLGRFTAEKNAGLRAAAAMQFEQASRRLSAALGQWRGPALDDLRDFEFVAGFGERLEEERIVVLTARADAEIACGRAHAVIMDLEALIASHPYREPLWAQLITAYYVAGRQSDALDAYRRLKSTLADELGIDPGPALRELSERILRQDSLPVRGAAQSRAEDTLVTAERGPVVIARPAALCDRDGHRHVLVRAATRIGRNPDNDIVLSDPRVSRYHAVVTVDGTAVMITDFGSANGVHVRGQRIHTVAELHDGDRLCIGDHEFMVELHEFVVDP
jgi:SARP family transcriptional regulator, regulator of embCAB operon